MEIQKIPPLSCPECKGTNVNQKPVLKGMKRTNNILSCYDCKKDVSLKDGEKTEHKNRPFYGRSGRNVSRYEMGDYKDHQGN